MLGRNADVEDVLRQSGNPRVPREADEADFRLSSFRRRRCLLALPSPAAAAAAAVFVAALFGVLNIDLTCSQSSPTSEKRSGRRRRAALMGLSPLVAMLTFVDVPSTCQLVIESCFVFALRFCPHKPRNLMLWPELRESHIVLAASGRPAGFTQPGTRVHGKCKASAVAAGRT